MPSYSENTGQTLLDGSSDPEGQTVSLRRINGTTVTQWPHVVDLPTGQALVGSGGDVTYDDAGEGADHPPTGQNRANGLFTFTLWDGIAESPDYTCRVTLSGLPQPPQDGPGWDAVTHSFDTTQLTWDT